MKNLYIALTKLHFKILFLFLLFSQQALSKPPIQNLDLSSPLAKEHILNSWNFGSADIGVQIQGPGMTHTWSNVKSIVFTFTKSGASDFIYLHNTCTSVFSGTGACSYQLGFKPNSAGIKSGSVIVDWTEITEDALGNETTVSGSTTWNLNGIALARPPKTEKCERGSIIRIDSQSLGEVIPIVGSEFSLFYSSRFSPDYVLDPGTDPLQPQNSFNKEAWTISSQHYYEPQQKRLYLGNGTVLYKEHIVQADGTLLVVDSNGEEIYIFDQYGKHLKTLTFLTGVVKYTFAYDSNDDLTSIQDAFGNQTILNRSSGIISSIQAPRGQLTTVSTSAGKISVVTNPKGESYVLTYKPGTSLLESFQKPGGQTNTFTYDVNGRLTKDQGQAGNFWSLDVDPNSGDITKKSALTRQTVYQKSYQANGNYSTTITTPAGLTVNSVEYLDGTYVTNDVRGETANYVTDDERFGSLYARPAMSRYSVSGNHSSVIYQTQFDPGGGTGFFDYISYTLTASKNSHDTVSIFNKSSSTWTTTSPEGVTLSVKLDSHERPFEIQTGNDVKVNLTYNSNGKIQSISQGGHNSYTYVYNGSGYLQTITNARSETTSFTYDLAGRIASKTSGGKTVSFTYDANGNVTSITTPAGISHAYEFNLQNLISKYLPPSVSGVTPKDTTYSYNLDGQLTQISKPNGQYATFSYGTGSGLLNTISTLEGTYTRIYSSTIPDLLTSIQSPQGVKNNFSYYGPWISEDEQRRASDNFKIGSVSFGFDSSLRVSSRTVTDSAGASHTTNITLNQDEKPKYIGSDMYLEYSSLSGRLTKTQVGSVSDERTYDTYGNLIGYSATYGLFFPTEVYSYSLVRDSMSRIVEKTETILGTTSNYTYTYDSSGRLTGVTKNGSQAATFSYDNNGNRVSSTYPTYTVTATYDSQDRLQRFGSKNFTYDQNGDLSKITFLDGSYKNFSYSTLGNLTEVSNSDGTTYQNLHDGLNRRVALLKNGNPQRRFLYENNLRIAAELNGSGITQKVFMYATKVNTPDFFIQGNETFRIITDHLGSPVLVVNASDGTVAQRMEYDVWGRILIDTNSCFQPFGFAGGVWDKDAGLVRFGARDYDPETGRWTRKDPILFSGDDTNLYGYVMNDPINYVDYTGESRTGYVKTMFWVLLDQATGGGGGHGASLGQLERSIYTKEILFGTGAFDSGSNGTVRQCPIPQEKEPNVRLTPFRPGNGLPDYTWGRSPGV